MLPKIRYEVDPHNRLVIDETGEKADLTRFRKILDGRFAIGPGNSLIYHVKAPVEGVIPDYKAPHQVKLRGIWSLTDNRELKLTLDKWQRPTFGDELILQGEIIDVYKNALLFALSTKSKDGTETIYTLKLEGAWQADRNNRLTFRVKKEEGKFDALTFDGIWEIGENYQIIYNYERSDLARKHKKVHRLVFKGHWDIKDKARISYIIDKDTDSIFNFSASTGIFKEDYIRYELGIGLSDTRNPARRIITLFGNWRIKKDAGLFFDVAYENKKVSAITFGAEAKLTDRDTIFLRLINENKKDMGIQVELAHDILKRDGQAFLRLLKSKGEAAIYIGAAWRW